MPAEDDIKLMEISESPRRESRPSVYPAEEGSILQTGASRQVNQPSISSFAYTSRAIATDTQSGDVIHSIPKNSSFGTVTSCSLLLSSAPAGPGGQVISPIFSVANPSDLIRDVELVGGKKTHSTTSSVLLIPATQLSTVEFSTKSVNDDDPVSLILHIPVQSPMSP